MDDSKTISRDRVVSHFRLLEHSAEQLLLSIDALTTSPRQAAMVLQWKYLRKDIDSLKAYLIG